MKILIADGHTLYRIGLREMLRELEEDLEFVETCDLESTFQALNGEASFDLLLVDLEMPGVDGLQCVAALRARAPDTPLVVVSGEEYPYLVQGSLARGAAGFLRKSMAPKIMLSAVRLVLSGGMYVPVSVLTERTTRSFGELPSQRFAAPNGASTPALTPRQRDVLGLLARGKSNKEIARALDLAEGTIKVHIAAIFKTLQVNNRTEAVAKSIMQGAHSEENRAAGESSGAPPPKLATSV